MLTPIGSAKTVSYRQISFAANDSTRDNTMLLVFVSNARANADAAMQSLIHVHHA